MQHEPCFIALQQYRCRVCLIFSQKLACVCDRQHALVWRVWVYEKYTTAVRSNLGNSRLRRTSKYCINSCTSCFFSPSHLPGTWYTFAPLLQLPPFRNSDPGSHNEHTSPRPDTLSGFIFIARSQHFFPSLTRLVSNCAYYIPGTIHALLL